MFPSSWFLPLKTSLKEPLEWNKFLDLCWPQKLDDKKARVEPQL
jgi:hypothetical protein